MGLIPGMIPRPIPGTDPQGKGRDRKGMERVACDSIHRHSVKAGRADAWMAADAARTTR